MSDHFDNFKLKALMRSVFIVTTEMNTGTDSIMQFDTFGIFGVWMGMGKMSLTFHIIAQNACIQ
jgi:hypothetical protein